MNVNPFGLEAAQIYKIYVGRIHEIEAMGFTLPIRPFAPIIVVRLRKL